MTDKKFPVKKTTGDHVLAMARGALGAIPFAGSAASEVLGYVFTPPLLERQREWFDALGERIERLDSERGITPEQLRDKPLFIDAVATATQAALRTSSKEKRNALRNAALNAGLPGSPEQSIQQIFFAITDRFSDRHILLLRFAQDAMKFKTASGTSLPQNSSATRVLRSAFPDADVNEALYQLVWTDLYSSGLVKLPNLENGPEGDARTIHRTTAMGDAYLTFIRSPFSDDP